MLELTFREALRMGHNYIRTEHILPALAEFENGTGVLADLGIDKEAAETPHHCRGGRRASRTRAEATGRAAQRPARLSRRLSSRQPQGQPASHSHLKATGSAIPNLRPPPAPQIIPICTPTRTTRPLTPSVQAVLLPIPAHDSCT